MIRFLRRASALFFACSFIIIASFSACSASFGQSLLNVDTYKQTLVKQNIYEDLFPKIIPIILEESQREQTEDDFAIDFNNIEQFMSEGDWRRVSEQFIPPQWLQNQTESLLDILYEIIQGDTSQRENIVNLAPIIQRLQGIEAQQASQIIIESAPACTEIQILQIEQYNNNIIVDEDFAICNPSSNSQVAVEAVRILQRWFNQLGLVLDNALSQRINEITITEDRAELIFNTFQLASQLSLLYLLCPLSLVGLVIGFGVRSRRGFGRWLGMTAITTGIIIILLIFMSQVPVISQFDDVSSASTEIQRFQTQLTAGFLRSVYVDASATMLIWAGIMIAIGFVLLVIAMIQTDSGGVSVLVTEDGEVISTTQSQNKTE